MRFESEPLPERARLELKARMRETFLHVIEQHGVGVNDTRQTSFNDE